MKYWSKTLKLLFLILNILLTSSILVIGARYVPDSYEVLQIIIAAIAVVPFFILILLQCFFIPQIAFVILFVLTCIVLIRHKKANILVKRDVVHLILLILWAIAGMYPAWYAFLGAMSV